jgi:hypothetical protein
LFFVVFLHIVILKEEGKRKKEEGRRKKEEGRRKKEEGRRKKEEVINHKATKEVRRRI